MKKRIIASICTSFLVLAVQMAAAERLLDRSVLDEINRARTEPQRYVGFLREFRRRFKGTNYTLPGSDTLILTDEGVKAVDEAIRVLSRQKPLKPLAWSAGLAAAADELADAQAVSGATGHGDGDDLGARQRIERHGKWSGAIGENIGYGSDEARLMVMQLIVDDGVPGRGHRKNLFTPSFSTAGVACGFHPRFGRMCVIDFADRFEEGE